MDEILEIINDISVHYKSGKTYDKQNLVKLFLDHSSFEKFMIYFISSFEKETEVTSDYINGILKDYNIEKSEVEKIFKDIKKPKEPSFNKNALIKKPSFAKVKDSQIENTPNETRPSYNIASDITKPSDKKVKKTLKEFGIIVWLLFFFPVGLYLMFKNKVWNAETRAIIMCFLLFPIGIYLIWEQNLFSKAIRISLTSIIPLILIIMLFKKEYDCIQYRSLNKEFTSVYGSNVYYDLTLGDAVNEYACSMTIADEEGVNVFGKLFGGLYALNNLLEGSYSIQNGYVVLSWNQQNTINKNKLPIKLKINGKFQKNRINTSVKKLINEDSGTEFNLDDYWDVNN